MSGNELESHLGVAMAAMESAKLRLLCCFDLTYPHMIDERERRKWTSELFLAKNSLTQAHNELDRALMAPMLKVTPIYPPIATAQRVAEPSGMVNPTSKNATVALEHLLRDWVWAYAPDTDCGSCGDCLFCRTVNLIGPVSRPPLEPEPEPCESCKTCQSRLKETILALKLLTNALDPEVQPSPIPSADLLKVARLAIEKAEGR